MRNVFAILTVMLVIVMVSGMSMADDRYRQDFHKTFSVDSDTEITIGNVNGAINVTTWDRNEIEVNAEIRAKEKSALEDVEIVIETGRQTSIETKYDRNSRDDEGYFDRMKKRMTGRNRASVNYEIRIPSSARLKKAGTTNGSVHVEGVSGLTGLTSTNGSISADTENAIIIATTTNGNIKLSGSSTVERARTTNGSITASITEQPKGDINLSTTNGSITLYIPKNIDAELDCSTTNGRVRADGFTITVNSIKKNHLKGRLGDGGYDIKATTTNGSITLKD